MECLIRDGSSRSISSCTLNLLFAVVVQVKVVGRRLAVGCP
jgi:hypothetical protein